MQVASRTRASVAARNGAAARQPLAVVCKAQGQPSKAVQAVASKLVTAGLAAGIILAGQPVGAAFAYNNLADIVRDQYSFVDADKDGVITKQELVRTSQEYAEEIDFSLPSNDAMDFSLRLFDLNQDGKLTTDELLTSIVLDGAVNESERVVDEAVYQVFDKDTDGFVSFKEFQAATPDLGANSDAIKEYLFKRVDRLVDGDGKLDGEEFVNTLALFRNTVLGY